MRRRLFWIIIALAVAIAAGNSLTAAAAGDELRIVVLENQEFKIEGDNVHIVGKLKITKGDLSLIAGEIIYNSEEKTAIVSGEPFLKTDDAELDGDMIEADFDAETFIFTGSVQIKQEHRVALADEIRVNNKTNTYLLLGNVLISEDKDQKELRAEEVLISSDPDIIEVKGPVEISFILEDKTTDQEEADIETEEIEVTEQVTSEDVYVQVESVSSGQQ